MSGPQVFQLLVILVEIDGMGYAVVRTYRELAASAPSGGGAPLRCFDEPTRRDSTGHLDGLQVRSPLIAALQEAMSGRCHASVALPRHPPPPLGMGVPGLLPDLDLGALP